MARSFSVFQLFQYFYLLVMLDFASADTLVKTIVEIINFLRVDSKYRSIAGNPNDNSMQATF